ncbi:cytosine permease, partial [Glaciimonas sp. Cout2]|nr:cytosine permease [Glaciimonas sp. Cout2]
LGLVAVIVLNMYGGSLTLISTIDSISKVRPTVTDRIVTVAITAGISGVLSLYASSNFAVFFADFLLLVLYFFIPWTAINLTDYF